MKVWWLDYHPAFNTAEFSDVERYAGMRELFKEAKPLGERWVPCEVKITDKGKPADFLREAGGVLVVSQRAREMLEQLPGLNVEFLPLISSDGEFSILNPLTVLDCVNPLQSKETRLGGNLMDYEELELIEDKVRGHDLYKIKLHQGDRLLPHTYVSDKLKRLIESRLEGYQLIERWDSETTWIQKEAAFAVMCEEIDRSLKSTFGFRQALKYVKKNVGEIAYSDKWALKSDTNQGIWLGQLLRDGTYSWISPIYYPPIILELTWGTVEKRKGFALWR